jgi:hypothetical protein
MRSITGTLVCTLMLTSGTLWAGEGNSSTPSSDAAPTLSKSTDPAAATAVKLAEPAPAKDPLAPGWQLQKLPGGAVLKLAPGAEIKVEKPTKLMLGAPGNATTPTQVLRLISGTIEIDVPKSKIPKTAVFVRGEHGAGAVVPGGHAVAVTLENSMSFAAVDADMLAAQGEKWTVLPQGIRRAWNYTTKLVEDGKLLGAPTGKLERSLFMANLDEQRDVSLDLDALPGAAGYEADLFRVTPNGAELVDRRRSTSTRIGFRVGPGRYEIAARAVDAFGAPGAVAANKGVNVVSYELPPHAYVGTNGVVLDPKQRLTLIGADGLELTYDRANYFVKAPGSVGMSRGLPTLVRLREPGGTVEADLWLMPRTLRANVEIGPVLAVFPRDSLTAKVSVTDFNGKPSDDSRELKLTTTVNGQPLNVEWARQGGVFSTSIPAQPGSGPWIVRVEVTDDMGNLIGRQFLEVDAAKKAATPAMKNGRTVTIVARTK